MRQFHLALCLAAVAALLASPIAAQIRLQPVGTYATGLFDASAAEIAAYDPEKKRLFSTNTGGASVDAIDISNPAAPRLLFAISVLPYGLQPNGVAVRQGVVAAAVQNQVKTDPGSVVFFDTEGRFLKSVTVGALPDMLTFTPDGRKVLVANEGEPNSLYTIDPEGSVSIIDISGGIPNLTQDRVTTAHFRAFTRSNIDSKIRIYGPNATVAQDLEPEYITVSADSRLAFVTLEENNAIGVLDINAGAFTRLMALGFKDHRLAGNALDASDMDGGINITTWPVFGMYQPDTIASYTFAGSTFLVTGNEGDERDYAGFSENVRVRNQRLDPTAFPNAASLQLDSALGRLTVTKALGDTDGDGDYDQLFVPGGRSFSIWTERGELVFDSGDQLERIIAQANPAEFNSDFDRNGSFDQRSDNRGPEPEGVAVGQVGDRTYAFIGIERMGGVMAYDITNPFLARFVQYVNNRNFAGNPRDGTAGDLGPEGVLFIRAEDSPDGRPLVVLSNEVSGTVTIYAVTPAPPLPPRGRRAGP